MEFGNRTQKASLVKCSAFQINYPLDWEFMIESTKDDTTYVFTEKHDTSGNLELTDVEFEIKYNNFQTISLTFGKMYKSLNYDTEFETVYQQISKNELNSISESGVASFNNRKAKWIKYDDNSYKKDNLECESITTCLTNSKYYVWIIIQTFGDQDKELRKCKAMEIIKTIKLKV